MKHRCQPPTYEVTGAVGRFDERDTLFAREHLRPGSPQARAYYAAHPERAEADREIRRYIEAKQGGSAGRDWRTDALYDTVFGPVAPLGEPDQVEGEPAERQVAMEPAVAAARVKQMARFLGAARVRVGPLRREWIYTHRGCPPFSERYGPRPPFRGGVPDHYRDLQWGDPIALDHRQAVVMAFPQDLEILRTSPSPAADLEVGRVYARSALAAVQLARFIRGMGYPARAHHMRNSAILLVPVAVDAGLGELSRAGYLLAPGLGLDSRLSGVTTDLPLAEDGPVDLGIQDFCNKCRKCATTCPARAIPAGEKEVVRGVRKWQIDAPACLAYWGRIGSACAICQAVCPWSKPATPFHRAVTALAIRVPSARRFLVWADDLVYGAGHRRRAEPGWLAR